MSSQPGFNTVWPSFLGMNSQMNADNQELSFKPTSVGHLLLRYLLSWSVRKQ